LSRRNLFFSKGGRRTEARGPPRSAAVDEHQLDRLLVVEGERLVGIISEADIRLDEGPLV
jgi:CBS domain-containing protein